VSAELGKCGNWNRVRICRLPDPVRHCAGGTAER